MGPEEKHYEFGKNWSDFIKKNISQTIVDISKTHLLNFVELSSLEDMSVLDMGCGSGLHSVAMYQAGAKPIHSVDYDVNSVEITRFLHGNSGSPPEWTIEQGSVLDTDYINSLPTYDLVYSWGVLHHTGDVWSAIRNAASRVKNGGLFYIALYSANVQIDPPPEFWLDVKRKYNKSGWLVRHQMEAWYVWRFVLHKKIRNINAFIKQAREYKKNRGMNIFTDIRDWLGGWPMEFVYDEEAVKFCEGLGFKLKKIVTGEANTEFLFIRE